MKREMRIRTALIPAKGLLSAIPNTAKKVLSQQSRKEIVVKALEERVWLGYRTLPADYSYDQTPYAGQSLNTLRMAAKGVSEDDIQYMFRCLIKAVDKTLTSSFGTWPMGFLEDGAIGSVAYSGPFIFDHGVSFEWHNDYLVVKWIRPTVDMREMGVESYLELLADEWAHKKVTHEVIRSRLRLIQLKEILSVSFVPPL